MRHKVFISYSTKDADVAKAVCKALEAEDVPCWIAPRDILPGEEYADAIIEALNNCQLFLVILSEGSNSSPQVRREVERAVSKNLSILTFRIDNTILSKAMEYYLSNRHWLDASQSAFSKQLQSLSAAVQKLIEQPPASMNEIRSPEPVEVTEPVKPVAEGLEKTPVYAAPSQPAKARKKKGTIWILAPVLLLILAAAAYFGLAGGGELPFMGGIAATSTPFPDQVSATNPALPDQAAATEAAVPTSNFDYAGTVQAYDATSAAMAGDNWIQGFAEPLLAQIASRSPDFRDDFSNPNWSTSQWKLYDGASFNNGMLVIAAANQWHGAGFSAQTSDFVVKFKVKLTKGAANAAVQFGFSFRGDPGGEASNHFTLNTDGWCGFGVTGPATSNTIINECKTAFTNLEQTASVTLIVQGDQAAAYVNDQPMAYIGNALHSGNEISIGSSVSEGTATASLEDVEFWYLGSVR